MADGQVVFEIKGDASNVNQTVKQVTSNIQSESKKWDQAAGNATGDIEKSFANMAGKIVGSLAAAGIGTILLNWGKAAIDAASDLAEVQNVVDTVFGEGANQIDAWAKKAGQQFGLTETQAKKFTSTLGAMMKSSGLAGDEIINMSTDLAGLAADMASFYNLDFDTAFEKIRSGISGETMPLKQLGINMSVANLNAFALAHGLDKTFEQMDQGEQTMLRYQYIMQATSDAQGDFSKTADGYANSQRRIQSALDTISTVAGGFLLNTIEPLVSGVADFLAEITKTPERTVLDDFNDIDVDTAGKMADLKATYDQAKAIIDVMAQIEKQTIMLKDGSTITFGELFADLGNVEANGGDVRGYLESLGVDVDSVILKYNEWKESTKQLTSLVPSLTSVIDSETGAIDGGTEAIQRNLDEWKAAQEKKLAWAAYYAKAQALEEAKAEQYKYQFTADAKAQLRKNFEAEHAELARLYKEKGGLFFRDYSDWGVSKEDAEEYMKLVKESTEAEKELTRQTDAYAQAEEELAAGKQALIDKYGEEEKAAKDATEAVDEWDEATKTAGKDAVTAAESAIKALADYVKQVKDSTAQAVDSTLKGFGEIERAGESLREKQADLGSEYVETEKKHEAAVKSLRSKYGDNWLEKASQNYESLTDAEKEAYNALAKIRNEQNEVNKSLDGYKPEGMIAGLESQKKYMEEYLANLKQLQEWGVSDELLASLSDGSQESAEFLAGLVSGGEDAAKEVGDMYEELAEQKKSFSDALAEQKLAADETYDALVQKALDAVDELNLHDEAAQSMADTVEGIAEGIAERVPDVRAAVDSIEEQLNRLSSWGMTFRFGGGGIEFGSFLDGEHETGLNYVPFDGYLASLHEGEGILTAEENRVWQRFKNSQGSGVDYEALGGVMRENVHAGGNVYLDGKTVGQVVSGIQGNQYRALQRSGWQG